MPAEYEVGQGYGKVAWDVRAIWENYSGWFHHRSTTELYPVGFDAVSADLVELAGADAIVTGRANTSTLTVRCTRSTWQSLSTIPGRATC